MSRVFKVDYIADPDRGRPLWNAKIYVGIPNEDPTIPSNQIQLTGDIGFPVGQSIPVPQPVRTNKGGVTVYNNSPLDLNAPGQQYAIAIYDRNDNLIYNFPQVDGSVAMNTTSQEEVTGLTIWPEVGEAVIGQTIPAGTDAIRYPFNGRSTLFTLEPPVAVTGVITDITVNTIGIGSLEVDNSDVYALQEYNVYIASNAGDSQLAGGAIWPLSSQDSVQINDNLPLGTIAIRVQGSLFKFISQDGSRSVPNGQVTALQIISAPFTATIDGVDVYLLKTTVSDSSYFYGNVQAYGAVGDQVANDSPAIDAAIKATGQDGIVYFPEAPVMYRMDDGVNERTNGGRRRLIGINNRLSQIYVPAAINTPNEYAFWFGNSNGHGAYGLKVENIGFIAEFVAMSKPSCIFAQEAGISSFHQNLFRNFNHAVRGSGATDVIFTGKHEFYSCVYGVFFNEVYNGTPTEWTATITAGPFSPSNEVIVQYCWFADCQFPVTLGGDKCDISYCTAQSCGDGPNDDLFVISSQLFSPGWTGSSFGGGYIHDNWVEGGTSRYAVRFEAMRNSKAYNNFIIGAGGVGDNTREGGVLFNNGSTDSTAYGNVFFQFFTATPTEGRLANAAVYVSSDSTRGFSNGKNRLYKNQSGNTYYFEGEFGPTFSKTNDVIAMAVVSIDDASSYDATIENSKAFIGIARIEAQGRYRLTLPFNLENSGVNLEMHISVNEKFAAEPVVVPSVFANAGSSIEVEFYDGSGVRKSPKSFTVTVKGEEIA